MDNLAPVAYAAIGLFVGVSLTLIVTEHPTPTKPPAEAGVPTPPKAVETGGYAFPHSSYMERGLTLRQWYAGQYISGTASRGPFNDIDVGVAFAAADAMIAYEKAGK